MDASSDLSAAGFPIRNLKKLIEQLVVEMRKTCNALRHNDSSRVGSHEAWEIKGRA
jgi:hypothetical protein